MDDLAHLRQHHAYAHTLTDSAYLDRQYLSELFDQQVLESSALVEEACARDLLARKADPVFAVKCIARADAYREAAQLAAARAAAEGAASALRLPDLFAREAHELAVREAVLRQRA
jgi:hypothetical protein